MLKELGRIRWEAPTENSRGGNYSSSEICCRDRGWRGWPRSTLDPNASSPVATDEKWPASPSPRFAAGKVHLRTATLFPRTNYCVTVLSTPTLLPAWVTKSPEHPHPRIATHELADTKNEIREMSAGTTISGTPDGLRNWAESRPLLTLLYRPT